MCNFCMTQFLSDWGWAKNCTSLNKLDQSFDIRVLCLALIFIMIRYGRRALYAVKRIFRTIGYMFDIYRLYVKRLTLIRFFPIIICNKKKNLN